MGVNSAATIHVPGDYAIIQDAIGAADTGDQIVVAPGTYAQQFGFAGKSIEVTSTDPDHPEQTVVDATGLGTAVHFTAAETADSKLVGFTLLGGVEEGGADPAPTVQSILLCDSSAPTIRKCVITGGQSDGDGGGAYCSQAAPTFEDCEISYNRALHRGGGVYCDLSSPIFIDCQISDNEAGPSLQGGGLYGLDSDVELTGCEIARNQGSGVFLWSGPRLAMENCTVIGNQGENGGGIRANAGTLVILSGCVVRENSASLEGGGIYGGDLRATQTQVVRNSAGTRGGGIAAVDSSSLVLTNCALFRNTAADDGGALYLDNAAYVEVSSCLITGNTCVGNGGAIAGFAEAELTTSNCTFWNNFAGGEGGGLFFSENSMVRGHNCILWDNPPSAINASADARFIYSDVEGGWPGVGNLAEHPLFWRFGGMPVVLANDSPCVDAGHPEILDRVSDSHPAWPEYYPNGERSDMGVYGGPENAVWLSLLR